MDMQKAMKRLQKNISKEVGDKAIVLFAINDGTDDGNTAFGLMKPKNHNPRSEDVFSVLVAAINGVFESLKMITTSEEDAKMIINKIINDTDLINSLRSDRKETIDKDELN